MTELVLDRISTIFGPDSGRAWPLIAEGRSKTEILERTGLHIALNNVSLSVVPGEILAVMGTSGSGKSTLLRTFNLLARPTRGHVTVSGQSIDALSDAALRDLRRATFGMVFQSFGLLPHLTVLDNVGFPLLLAGVTEKVRHPRAMAWLDRIGLAADASSLPAQLSAGMQQRVGLARALINDPPVLLMDEPFAALDPITRRDMQDEVLRLQAELKKTIVIITHDPADALRLADRVAILRDGSLIQLGTYRDITLHPADSAVAAFVRGFGPARPPAVAAGQ